MNQYFTHLVGRHLGTEALIQPRLPGRFETDFSRREFDSIDGSSNPVIPQTDTPEVKVPEGDKFKSENNDLPNNLEAGTDAPSLTVKPQDISSIDDVVHVIRKPDFHTKNRENKNENEKELINRIRSMQRLVGNSNSPNIESALIVADDSLDSVSTPGQIKNQRNKTSAAGQENNPFSYDPVQPPLWMSEITTRFNTGIKEKEAKTDPIINVTIGRVEVRAVQTGSPKKVRQSKKPTGIMPLDEYLKKRESK